MYLPLPYNLTIKTSGIHGLGLFAVEDIEADYRLGITHIFNINFENGYARTPLGGFLNHSDKPNCMLYDSNEFRYKKLKTLHNIKTGDELTIKYTLYSLNSSMGNLSAKNT
jgi:SET domain-containing protein